jgi:guanylate cyclase
MDRVKDKVVLVAGTGGTVGAAAAQRLAAEGARVLVTDREAAAAVAGVIGRTKFAYDVWGDTVNTASRLEGECPPGSVLVSDATRRLLADVYALRGRRTLDIRGRGPIEVLSLTEDAAPV